MMRQVIRSKTAQLLLLSSVIIAIPIVAQAAEEPERTCGLAFSDAKVVNDETVGGIPLPSAASGPGSQSSLYNGISPGYTLDHTWRDDQSHLTAGRMIDWRVGPQIHSVWASQPLAGHDYNAVARWCTYHMFDPRVPPGIGITAWLQPNPLVEGGWQPNLDVDETGHAVVVCETFNVSDPLSLTSVYWDVSGPGIWGTFVSETLTGEPYEYVKYPRIEYQDYSGQYIAHVIALLDFGDPADDLDAVYYFRKSGSSTGPGGTWTSTMITDRVWSNQYAIAASRYSGRVAICWIEWPDFSNGSGPMEGELYLIESYDGGENWTTPISITENLEDGYRPWVDVSALFDSDEYLHVVYTAMPGDRIDPARVMHWSDRVPGPDAGGYTTIVQHAGGLEHMCGRGGANVASVAKPVISECNNRLYVVWQQYGDMRNGDTLDCPEEAHPNHYGPLYNAEIYMSVSMNLDGLAYDAPRNLSNTKSPDCDGDEYMGGPCENEVFPTVSRYGYNNSYNGAYYWDAVSEVYEMADMLDPSYSDEWYLDIQYIVDLMTEPARYADDQQTAVWTNNPIKWNRIPCVDPVLAGRILVDQEDFLYPEDWVKTGEEVLIDPVVIRNIGNQDLTIYDIRADMISGPSGSVDIYPTSMAIPAGAYDQFTVVLNPGGAVTAPDELVADINIDSDDPYYATYLAFQINTVIADSVAPVVWDTISTYAAKLASGPALTVATNGNAGNSGVGRVNLDFAGYIDCDETQDVYLSDLTSVIMYDGSGAEGTYFWAPEYEPSGIHNHGFHPQTDGLEPAEAITDDFQVFSSGTYATADSVIGCTKHFVAPLNNDSYILERWDIYSLDGLTHTGVWLGEWVDWDVPSYLQGLNEGGYLASFGGVDCLWQQGIADLTAPDPPCMDHYRRYGASGLLGWFYSSEYDIDPDVNHIGLWSGNVLEVDDLHQDGWGAFSPDSIWEWLSQRPGLGSNASGNEDTEMLLGYGSFDIYPDDTLRIWTVHASVYDGEEADVEYKIASAQSWYFQHRELYTGCGCGNVNCSSDGKVNFADIAKLIDYLFVSQYPLTDPDAANIDLCNGIDMADLFLLIDHVYITKDDICTGEVDCNYQPDGDTVQLAIRYWPHDHVEYDGKNQLQIDLWVRNLKPLKALEIHCGWDNPNVRLVGTTTTSVIDSFFYPDPLYKSYLAYGGDNDTRTFYFEGFNEDVALPPDSVNKWIWVRYMFEVDSWSAGDSIVIDLQPTHSGATLKAVASEPGGELVLYRPYWNGPLVIRDGFEQCCGMYALAPDQTGNTNCSFDGKLTLADISRLIDKIYISKEPLCCSPNGNTNGSEDLKHTLSDISELIDRLYISKLPAADCL